MKRILLGALCALMAAGAVQADDFHGFDPGDFDGAMLSADQLAAMVADAKKANPPKNGEQYVIGFANLQRDISFGVLVENGIKANADAAGIGLLVADNRLDGPTALSNAQSFAQRNVDYAIEFQTDVNFGPAVMKVFNDAGVKVTAIDIPMPDATFFGANNPKSGYMGGSYLAQAAINKFGPDAVKKGYFVVGALPQSGAIPAMRTNGQIAGFKATVDGFPEDHLITIDTKNTQQESYTQMSNVLGRIPEGVPIMVTAINDQATLGMLQAVKAAGRDGDLIGVGNGADEAVTMATLTVRLSREEIRELDEAAAECGVDRSDVVRIRLRHARAIERCEPEVGPQPCWPCGSAGLGVIRAALERVGRLVAA